jgi:two-component system, cell cycle response regulator DivK
MLKDAEIGSWTVLIVDDEPDNVGVAAKVLQFHGTKVHTATNGEDGLHILENVVPTLVLLDISMPQMNGWAMLQSIREIPKFSKLPVIALTAYAMHGDKERILDAGFNGYIAKPFDIYNFLDEIKLIMHTLAANDKVQ